MLQWNNPGSALLEGMLQSLRNQQLLNHGKALAADAASLPGVAQVYTPPTEAVAPTSARLSPAAIYCIALPAPRGAHSSTATGRHRSPTRRARSSSGISPKCRR